MRIIATAGTALLLGSSAVMAGGLDRSGQGITALFETGTVVELSYGSVMPDVSGSVGGGAVSSGNVGSDYNTMALSFKTDINDRISLALIVDEPFGANIDYGDADAGYPIAGSSAEFRSSAITALGRYKFNDRFSLHAGARLISIDANASISLGGPAYDATYDSASDVSLVVGGAFEIPDIALRVALTYATATEFTHTTTLQVAPGVFSPVPDTIYEMPQSVNLDFQTGIAADTLLFGSVRWADWSETEINSFGYPGNPLVGYDQDYVSYSIGVGRKFSDTFSGAISVGYEAANGDPADNLAPTDGYLSLQVGGTYTIDNIEITGGVRYVMLGDATTEAPISAEFADNSALGVGLSVAYRF